MCRIKIVIYGQAEDILYSIHLENATLSSSL